MKNHSDYISEEWKAIIKNSSLKNSEVANKIGINKKRFDNYYYGIIKTPKGYYEKIKDVVLALELNPQPLKKPVRKNKTKNIIEKIVCNICDNKFKPYGGDMLPICKDCLKVDAYIRKNKNVVMKLVERKYKAKFCPKKVKLYWDWED